MLVPFRKPRSDDAARDRDAANGPESISDEALVLQAQAGDQWAETALMRRHGREVIRVATRLLGSHQDAEDIAQDTFLAVFEQLDRLREPAAFRGWMLRIAVNRTRKVIRKRQLLRRLGLDRSPRDGELEALAAHDASPEIRAELRVVDEVLRQLGTDQRIAWMLRYVEGHTVRDVARLCSCSMATANRRIAAAQKRIQGVVNEEVLANE